MLLQAPGSIPSSFNVYLAGVNATAGAVPAAGACIQHPGGGGKRIAIASGACAPGAFAPAACPYRNAARRAQPWHLGTARPLAAERHAGRSERAPARAGRTSPPALRQSRCRAPMPRSYRPCSSRRARQAAGSGCNTALSALLLSTANLATLQNGSWHVYLGAAQPAGRPQIPPLLLRSRQQRRAARQVVWSSGATARVGSLGAPLLDATRQQVVGVLVAGTSSCANGGRPDYFGRLSAVRARP